MDFRKKLKLRLITAIIYAVVGVLIIIGVVIAKPDNAFISSFGVALAVMGIARLRNYFLITRNEETLRKQEITETDERNLSIVNKARSAAFYIYFMLSGVTVIVLSFLGLHEAAKWIACSVMLLAVIYWICYLVYRKKF